MADTYVATEDILVAPYVAAFRKGDVVPADTVKYAGLEAKTARLGTKAAEAAVKDVSEA